MTIEYSTDGAVVSNAATIDGAPAVRISGDDVHFTNTETGRITGTTAGVATIEVTGLRATIVNAEGGVITRSSSADVAISGSAGDDVVVNEGLIKGRVLLGDGDDSFTERAVWQFNGTIDMGAGDDLFRHEHSGAQIADRYIHHVTGGDGYDTLILAAYSPVVDAEGVSGFEALEVTAGDNYWNLLNFSGFTSIELPDNGRINFNASVNPLADLTLNGTWLTVGPGSSFRDVTGSDAAELLEVNHGTIRNASLGGGDDSFWIGHSSSFNFPATLIQGSVDGGSGYDWINVSANGGVTIDLAMATGFEGVNAGTFTSATSDVRIINADGYAQIMADHSGKLVIAESNSPNAVVGLAFPTTLILESTATVGQIGETWTWVPPIAVPEPANSVDVTNHGTVLGDVRLYTGDDKFDGRFGSVGGNVYGFAGNDELRGGTASDRLWGGYGADRLEGNGGDDVLKGEAGGDRLEGGAGADLLEGAAGSDTLFSHDPDADYAGFFGALGESLDVLAEADQLLGGDGDDGLFAGYGDTVDGGANDAYGDKLFISFMGAPTGVTADFRLLGSQASIVIGGASIGGIEEVAFIEGSNFNDFLAGWASSPYTSGNTIYGRGGNDRIIAGYYAGWNGSLISGGDGNDIIDLTGAQYGPNSYGDAGDDYLIGGASYERLDGGDGNDRIAGAYGFDSLYGGAGDDIIDGGSFGDSLFGETGNDTLYGAGDADTIEGGDGNDLIYGDYSPISSANGLSPASNDDILRGGAGADRIFGNEGNDQIDGGDDADQIDGGTGDDSMKGGAGNDIFFVDSAGDSVIEAAGQGTDEIRTSLASYSLAGLGNVESLTGLLATGQSLTGNVLSNRITGGSGNDNLYLMAGGNDTALGGAGDDTFFFGAAMSSADTVRGGAGSDLIVIQGHYPALTLAANLSEVEGISLLAGSNTSLGASGTQLYDYVITTHNANFAAGVNVKISGSALLAGEDFTFNGSAETDASFTIYGGKGVDTLTGGLGNDVIVFAEDRFGAGDRVNGGGGFDALLLRGSYVVDFSAPGYAGLISNIENLTLTSASDERYARGGGTEFDYNITLSDAIVGAGQALTVSGSLLMANETMILDGSQESDGLLRLFGGAAADTLKGGGQADLIHGSLGADRLTGGGGADSFRYQSTAESTSAAMDQILDFTPGTDRIDLAGIDANSHVAGNQAFTWIGSNAFGGTGAASAGQLRAYEADGIWYVQGDTNGDGNADLVIALTLQGPTPLGAGDFLL